MQNYKESPFMTLSECAQEIKAQSRVPTLLCSLSRHSSIDKKSSPKPGSLDLQKNAVHLFSDQLLRVASENI